MYGCVYQDYLGFRFASWLRTQEGVESYLIYN